MPNLDNWPMPKPKLCGVNECDFIANKKDMQRHKKDAHTS